MRHQDRTVVLLHHCEPMPSVYQVLCRTRVTNPPAQHTVSRLPPRLDMPLLCRDLTGLQ